MTDDEMLRFERNVQPEPNTGCWLWTAATDRCGYGVMRAGGKQRKAHRLAWAHAGNALPDYPAFVLDHVCNTPQCCNPDHLRVLANRANILRGTGRAAVNARKTHCRRGHELAGDNIRMSGNQRICRRCHAAYYHERPELRERSRLTQARRRARLRSSFTE